MMNFLGKLVTGLSRSQGYGVSDEDEDQELGGKKKNKPQPGLMSLMAPAEEEMDLSSTLSAQVGQPTGADPLSIYRKLYSNYGGRKTRGLLFD
jgi:hypothetical protein